MARGDTHHLEILARVAGQLQDLGGQVLENRRGVHGGGGADAAMSRRPRLELPVDAPHRELRKTNSDREFKRRIWESPRTKTEIQDIRSSRREQARLTSTNPKGEMGKRGKYLAAGAGGAGDGGLLLVLVLVGALCRRGLGREEPLASLARHRRRREALDLDRVRGVVRCKGRRVVLFKLTVACEERVICADLSMRGRRAGEVFAFKF